jgi:hypothetical protein
MSNQQQYSNLPGQTGTTSSGLGGMSGSGQQLPGQQLGQQVGGLPGSNVMGGVPQTFEQSQKSGKQSSEYSVGVAGIAHFPVAPRAVR